MSDFTDGLKACQDFFKEASSKLISTIDKLTYQALVDCLKSDDPQAVADAIDQLAKEKRPCAIAPLYLVAKGHPSAYLKDRARIALKQLISDDALAPIVAGKNLPQAVAALIDHFGYYRSESSYK